MKHASLLQSMKDRWPIGRVVISSSVSYAVLLFIHRGVIDWSAPQQHQTPSIVAAFLLGITYTHFFEYVYHRLLMHAGVRGLGFVKTNHLRHHRVFHGENFTSRNREDWQFISSPWFVFPGLLTIHYSILQAFVGPVPLVSFFAGALLHYLAFECTHWLTHVEGNVIDRWSASVPVLARVREYQIRHHRSHHEIPAADFNFNPPFLGDVVFGTLEVPAANEPRHSR